MARTRELPKSLPMGHRTLQIRAQKSGDGESASKSYPLTLATDKGVKRSGWWGWYYEILGHDAGEVETGRLERGLALLVNHDPNQRAGRIENGKVEGGKTTGEARFGTTEFARGIQQEVDDDTLNEMSVGYMVHEYQRTADVDPDDDEDEDYLGTYRAVSWEPYEGSLTPIPADENCGIGRSAERDPKTPVFPVRFRNSAELPPQIANQSKENRSMATQAAPVSSAPEPVTIQVGADQLANERKRAAHIALLARQYPDILTREKADEFLNNGTEGNAASAYVLEQARAKQVTLNSGSPVTLSDKERKQYSLTRAIRGIAGASHGFTEDAGFEREVSQTIAKVMGRDTGGIYIPTMEPLFRLTPQEIQKRALTQGSNAGGGYTVATELVSFLDVLRPAVKLFKLGAEFMGGMSSNFSLPKQLTDSDFNWVGENPGVDNTDIDPTFGQVAFTPKTATGSTSWSRQLFVQSSIDIEAKVRNSLVQRAAITMDKVGIQGTGSANQPKGILNATGVSVIALGTNGAVPSFQPLIDMAMDPAAYNADQLGELRYLITPEIAGYLQGQPKLANTIAQPIFTFGPDGQGYINGLKADWSNLLPKNLVKGTSGAVCHAGIAGVFNALTIAEWGAMEILLDPYTGAKQALIKITANFMMDVQPTYAQAFSVYLDALNTTAEA
jgi:HK97 family phage major capsid protein